MDVNKGWKMEPIQQTKESTFVKWRVLGGIDLSNMLSHVIMERGGKKNEPT
jgi:hypothetical protein